MNYTALVSSVIATTESESAEFIGQIPNMVGRAQDRILGDIDDIGLTSYVSIAVSINNPFITVPSGTQLVKGLVLDTAGSKGSLLQREYDYVVDYWPVEASVGTPRYYGFKTNTQIKIAPTPEATLNAEIAYQTNLTTLTSATQSNYLTDFCPSLLFDATMIEATYFMKDYAVLQAWQQQYAAEAARTRNRARRSRTNTMQDNWSPAGTPDTVQKGGS